MFWKNILFVIIVFSACAYCQDYNVKVTLKDSSIVEGKLIKISSEGVEINPGGNVKFRFISAARIKNVYLVESNKIVDYPLVVDSLPGEISEYESPDDPTQQVGFPNFLGIGTFGYASAGGDYYEGFNDGTGLRLGLYYYFHDSNRTASRFLAGFSYSHLSITGDKIYGIEPTLMLNEYSFEFGRTTGLFGDGSYLYLLFGLVIVDNDIEMEVENINGVTSSVHVSETRAALRIEGDASISLGAKFSILLSLGYDVVLAGKEQSTYYSYNEPAFSAAGGAFYATAGLTYAF